MDAPVIAGLTKTLESHRQLIASVLEENKTALNDVSQDIWHHPETCYQEHHAHKVLTEFLEKNGFDTVCGYIVPTAFRGEFRSAQFDASKHATVAVICEYDALPGIGHACAHNLIAESGIAAGLALKEVLRTAGVNGRVVVLGTPAEEGGGGKVDLIRAGAFKDIDFAMMVHPFPYNDLEPIILGIDRCLVKFHGRAAHASCGPWEGINALDAAVAAYQNIGLYRQQMKPNWRVHGVILNGGEKPNIIPDLTVSHYYLRTQAQGDMDVLKTRILAIFDAAAKATGCTLKVEWEERPYTGMLNSSSMAQFYKKLAALDGIVYPDQTPGFYGSTDMGNVSIEVPSIHPCVFVGQPYQIHTKDMARQAASPEAQHFILLAAKHMALTGVELFINDEYRHKVKTEFEQRKKTFMG